MEQYITWENWILLGIILFILEIFTPGFVVACIGIGALIASPFAFFEASLSVQLLAFSVGTLLAFISIRPYVLKHIYKSKSETTTNADSLISRIGKVKQAISNDDDKGRVIIDGDNWRAQSVDGSKIKIGANVEVISIESTILIVKQI